jgi:hypothetical protein
MRDGFAFGWWGISALMHEYGLGLHWRWCSWPREGEGLCPEGLCDDPLATDRVRASGRQHPIQDRHAASSLGLPDRETACAQDAAVQPIHVVQA